MTTKRSLVCGTDFNHQNLMSSHGERYRKNMLRVEQNWISFRSTASRTAINYPVVTIPVVVHIVHNTKEEDIGDSQVFSQLQVLNDDYRKKNTDSSLVPTPWKHLAADAKIEFRLDKYDPDGKPSNGITRTKTNTDQFVQGTDSNGNPYPEKVKFTDQGGKDGWDSTRYLNIWVCNIRSEEGGFGGGTLLGYAQFPGGPLETDGVVIYYKAFGINEIVLPEFNLGRTTVHEVGHWLGLRHIWGHDFFDHCSGTDNIPDTPNQASANTGKPSFPSFDQTCDGTGPNGTMFMNYMDYTDDVSMYMFTMGQIAKMRSVLSTSRSTLLTSEVLKDPKEESDLSKLRTLPPKVYDGADSMVEIQEIL